MNKVDNIDESQYKNLLGEFKDPDSTTPVSAGGFVDGPHITKDKKEEALRLMEIAYEQRGQRPAAIKRPAKEKVHSRRRKVAPRQRKLVETVKPAPPHLKDQLHEAVEEAIKGASVADIAQNLLYGGKGRVR